MLLKIQGNVQAARLAASSQARDGGASEAEVGQERADSPGLSAENCEEFVALVQRFCGDGQWRMGLTLRTTEEVDCTKLNVARSYIPFSISHIGLEQLVKDLAPLVAETVGKSKSRQSGHERITFPHLL